MTSPSIDEAIKSLRNGRDAARSRLRSLAVVSRGLTVLLAVVFVGFLFALYGQLTNQYTAEKFEEPLGEEAAALLPKLEAELLTLWMETAPVYSELALEKFELAIPELQAASQREMEILLANQSQNVSARVDEALTRIYNRHHERVKQQFPQLSDEQGSEEWGLRSMEAVEFDFEEIVLEFNALYTRDLEELVMTLEQFRPNPFEDMTEEQLVRQFLHLGLAKMDRLVLMADETDEHQTKGADDAS